MTRHYKEQSTYIPTYPSTNLNYKFTNYYYNLIYSFKTARSWANRDFYPSKIKQPAT